MNFKNAIDGYKKDPWRYCLWVILVVGALMNSSRFFLTEIKWDSARDFKIIYSGIVAYKQGYNPYDKAQMVQTWKSIAIDANIPFEIDAELGKGLQYPPITLFLMYPIAFLPYKVCIVFWYTIITVGIGIFLWFGGNLLLNRFSTTWYLTLLLVAIAFKGTIYTWILGQPLYLSAALGMLGLWFQFKGKSLISALLVGLSIIKVTIFIPFFAYYVFKGKMRAFIFCSGFVWVLILGSYFYMPYPEYYTMYLQRVAESQFMIFDLTRPDLFLGITTDFSAVLISLSPTFNTFKYFFIAGFIGLFGFWVYKKQGNRLWLFSTIFLLFYMAMYHGYYDLFMIVPLVTVFAMQNEIRPYHVLTAFYCCIPVNGIMKDALAGQPLILVTNMAWMTFLYFVFLLIYISDFPIEKEFDGSSVNHF